MKKPLRLTVAFLILFSTIHAQTHIKTGPEAGINFAKMSFKSSQTGMELKPSAIAAFHVGWVVQFNVAKNLDLQTGLELTTKGSRFNFDGTTLQLTPSYLEIPVNLMVKNIVLPVMFFSAGPYFSRGFYGNVQYGAIITNMNLGNSSESMIKRFDYGLDVGIGLDAPSIQISGKYEMSIANLSPGGYFDKIRNGVFEFSLTFFLRHQGYRTKEHTPHHRFLRFLKRSILP